MKRSIVTVVLFLCAAAGVFAQSGQVFDSILESDALTYGQAAYIALAATERIPESSDFDQAFSELMNTGWIKNDTSADSIIALKVYAFLLMKAFEMKGGLMYRIYPCPRYAYRDLKAMAMIHGRSDPGMRVSGLMALQLVGRLSELKGASQ